MTKPFRLSSTLAGHGSDVRSLSSSPTGPVLFSSSRDGTARSWYRPSAAAMDVDGESKKEQGGGWIEGLSFTGQHEGFVNAVQWVGGDGDGYLVTAGQDKLIHVWPLPSSLAPSDTPLTPSHMLIGHEANVCALGASKDGKTIVSGSWDKTAKVWKDFQLTYTLEGHEQSVWAVLALEGDEDLVLTGAADNLVKLWKGGKALRTFSGHTQAVRALAKLDAGVGGGDLFASAGNDASIRLWSLTTGEAVHVLYGHDSFIYSLSPIPDSAGGGLISGGEDRTMRVWRAADGECEQTLVIPAISVWAVTCLSNGDIAAGTSDGLVRVFTRSEDRVASAEALSDYDVQVSKTQVNSSQIGDVKKDNLPGLEALDTPGKKDGAVIMVKAPDGTVEAHSWSNGERSWTKIGEVTGGVGSSQKQMYMGQEYDHVFDVDFKDGAPKLKLPYNNGQNAYEAAQKFLFANELPLEYTEQIVEFIDKNTGNVTLGASDYVDPYTGASRYTGGGVPTQRSSSQGFSGDPFTGGGRTISKTPKILPHKTFLSFTSANLPALRSKLGQLNDELAAAESTSSLALSPSEITSLDSLVAYLLIANATPGKASRSLNEAETAVALKLLQWPSAQRFPGLDLLRLISLASPLLKSLPSLLEVVHSTSGPAKEQETNSMLAFRALANLFVPASGKSLVKDEAVLITEALKSRGVAGVSKLGKVALATIALNYSVLAVDKSLDAAAGQSLLDVLVDLLGDADGEVVYRSIMALGNLLLSPSFASSLPSSTVTRFKTLAKDASKRLPAEARIKVLVAEFAV
ncbi:WD40-repeat-containing domain protein [Leucosporidium creatinivorum]|uniref:WD40-repeat-containing domain protein n=1 Tax=Leucosporidium creatinivorum TaxID=106004 RepID=A0A1Y2DIL7_9BASI|nr:WD40-repeat-containing domain protein [Leucosporidium creatinivorum]